MKTFARLGTLILLGSSLLPAQQLRLEETHRFRFAFGATRTLAFSPDEKYLACGGQLGDVVVYDLAQQSRAVEFAVGDAPVRQCLFFHKGKRLAVLADDLSIWSFPEGRLLDRWPVGSIAPELSCMTVSPDSQWIAWRQDQELLIRESGGSRVVARVPVAWRLLGTLQFSADGNRLLVDGTLVWNWKHRDKSLSPLPFSKEQGRVLMALWIGPDSQRLIATDARQLRLGKYHVDLHSDVQRMTVSADGSQILVLLQDGRLMRLDKRLESIGRITIGSISAKSMFLDWNCAISSSGRLVASASAEEPVRVWSDPGNPPIFARRELASVRRPGDPLMILPGNAARPDSVAFAAGARHLALAVGGRIVGIDLTDEKRRQLGSGTLVATGWRPDEILIGQSETSTVTRVQAGSGESALLTGVRHRRFETSPASMVPSPTQTSFLYTMTFMEESCDYYLWSRGEKELHLDGYASFGDATWSHDGNSFLLITSLSGCVGPALPRIRIRSLSKKTPWHAAAERSASLVQGPLTGDFSLRRGQVTWGGRKGAVTYTKGEEGKGDIHRNRNARMVWLRYLDEDHILSHDEQILSLWRAKDLKLLATSNPFQISHKTKRDGQSHKTTSPDQASLVETSIFIYEAALSHNRKQLILVGNRDVRVFDLSVR